MAYRADLFLETIRQLRSGRTQEEAAEKLAQLVQDCRHTGKKGTLTIKMTINPDKGDTGQYFIADEITVKAPKFERGNTLMWGTPDGNLQRTDPNQGELPLRSVPDEEPAPRRVDTDSDTLRRAD